MTNENAFELLRKGHKIVGYESYEDYYAELNQYKEKVGYNPAYTTTKSIEYTGEVINDKGIVFYFPHYLVSIKGLNTDPAKLVIDAGDYHKEMINITKIISNHYGDDTAVFIRRSDLGRRGFRHFITHLLDSNITFLNASNITPFENENIENSYVNYHAYNILMEIVRFVNMYKLDIFRRYYGTHSEERGDNMYIAITEKDDYFRFTRVWLPREFGVSRFRAVDNNVDVVSENADTTTEEVNKNSMPGPKPEPNKPWLNYRVNLFVDNSNLDGAPVIMDSNYTYQNIFGKLEYENYYGSLKTDYTMLKPGLLHIANGGYIIFQAKDLLANGICYEALKKALRMEELLIENTADQRSSMVMV